MQCILILKDWISVGATDVVRTARAEPGQATAPLQEPPGAPIATGHA